MTKLEKLQKEKGELEASIRELSSAGGDVSALEERLRIVESLIKLISTDW